MGLPIQRWSGFDYHHLAPYFKGKAAEPFLVHAPYREEEQEAEIRTDSHDGQEFEYILSGSLRFVYDGHEENLIAGDSVYFDASKPHGMIATSKDGCTFLIVTIKGAKQ
jgi:mannose-6-phosphate isomerase-like protein (cupin superfamily)